MSIVFDKMTALKIIKNYVIINAAQKFDMTRIFVPPRGLKASAHKFPKFSGETL